MTNPDLACLTRRVFAEVDLLDRLAPADNPLARQVVGEAVARAYAHGQAVVRNSLAGRRVCRVCGCWELHACEGGCWWVAEDLCSTCDRYGPPPALAGAPA